MRWHKITLLLLFLTVKAYSQTEWTNIGSTQSDQNPYPFIYYLLFDLNGSTDGVLTEIEVMVTADLNYHYVGRYSIIISRWAGTSANKLDGVTMNYISGKPGLLDVFVFTDKVFIKATRKWGSIKYRLSYGTSGSWSIPLTSTTTPPSGYLTASAQPFYYNFDSASKYDYPALTADGKVGIKTDSPDAPLTVKGQIHAQEIKVDVMDVNEAPDYVFQDDYDLLPLSELEVYIQNNKHLPEIPSAREMKEDGVLLKEMNLKLLKKIEELTLYLLQQQEEISHLKTQVNDLKSSL